MLLGCLKQEEAAVADCARLAGSATGAGGESITSDWAGVNGGSY